MKKETDAEEMAPEYDFSKGTRGRYAGRFFPTGPWQVGERVVLKHDAPGERLQKGDVGEIVHRYEGGGAFRVRFDSGSGDPAAVLKLPASELRSLHAGTGMNEHDWVVLKKDIPEHSLAEGDVGTIVHVYGDGEAYEVEFILASGETVAVLTLEAGDVRPRAGREILHTRSLS